MLPVRCTRTCRSGSPLPAACGVSPLGARPLSASEVMEIDFSVSTGATRHSSVLLYRGPDHGNSCRTNRERSPGRGMHPQCRILAETGPPFHYESDYTTGGPLANQLSLPLAFSKGHRGSI